MKKVIYIGIAVVALGLASCSKQDIQPVNNTDAEVPVWKSNTNTTENVNEPSTTSGSNDGGITDPDPTEEESLNGGL